MTTDTSQWRHAYMAELERCAMSLPSDRRAELLDQIGTHLIWSGLLSSGQVKAPARGCGSGWGPSSC